MSYGDAALRVRSITQCQVRVRVLDANLGPGWAKDGLTWYTASHHSEALMDALKRHSTLHSGNLPGDLQRE